MTLQLLITVLLYMKRIENDFVSARNQNVINVADQVGSV